MSIHKKAFLLISTILILTCVLSACTKSPFRLHVIANSNSQSDQRIKLVVRDAVLEATKDGILQCNNADEASEYIRANMQTILSAANKTLEQNGYDYTASAQIGVFAFPEKTYGDVVYPEGDYSALRIKLGKAEGDNWWCVMFPPLCLSEIGALGEDYELPEDVEYKSFFAELFEKWRSKD